VAVYDIEVVGVVTEGLATVVLLKKFGGAQETPVLAPVKFKTVELPKQTDVLGVILGTAAVRFTTTEQVPEIVAVLTAVQVIVKVVPPE